MPFPPDTVTLVADIGGTNTRVALARDGRIIESTIRRFHNADYSGLGDVLTEYIAAENGVDCAGACAAVAGPVRDGVATLTNLDWTIDEKTLARATKAERVSLLNDLQAQGHALGHLPRKSLLEIIKGTGVPRPGASQLVIGIGTGFNAAPVHEAPGGRIVAASECGHASLPVRTEADFRLQSFVEKAHGFAGVEDVLSGRGLERVYSWVSTEAGRRTDRRASAIMTSIHDEDDPIATEAGRIFVRLLGTVAGNQALIHLPFGGVYLIGGVARAFMPWLAEFGFVEAFRDKGRFSGFMQNFSVYVIEDDYAALTGCAVHLKSLARA